MCLKVCKSWGRQLKRRGRSQKVNDQDQFLGYQQMMKSSRRPDAWQFIDRKIGGGNGRAAAYRRIRLCLAWLWNVAPIVGMLGLISWAMAAGYGKPQQLPATKPKSYVSLLNIRGSSCIAVAIRLFAIRQHEGVINTRGLSSGSLAGHHTNLLNNGLISFKITVERKVPLCRRWQNHYYCVAGLLSRRHLGDLRKCGGWRPSSMRVMIGPSSEASFHRSSTANLRPFDAFQVLFKPAH